MNNLFNPKVKIYQKKLSDREVYEQERFCQLMVEDRTGIVESKGGDAFINTMFEKMQNRSLNRFVYDEFNTNKLDITVKISGRGEDVVSKVIISKRHVSQRLKRLWEKLLKKEEKLRNEMKKVLKLQKKEREIL